MGKNLRRFITLLFFIIASTWLILNSVHLQRYIAEKVSKILSHQTGMEVSIDRISLVLPSSIIAHGLVLEHDAFVYGTAETCTAKLSLEELLNGKFVVETLSISDLNLAALPIKGSLQANVDLKSNVNRLDVCINIYSDEIKYQKFNFRDFNGTIDCLVKDGSIQARLNLNSIFEAYPVKFISTVDFKSKSRFDLTDVEVEVANTRMYGSLFANPENVVEGNFKGWVEDLSIFKDLWPGLNHGNAEFSINFTKSTADFEINSRQLKVNDIDIENFSLFASGNDFFSFPHATIKFNCDHLKNGNIHFEKISAETIFDSANISHPISVDCIGKFNLKANGSWNQQNDALQIDLNVSSPPSDGKLYLYHPLVENSHFDSARQSQIEALLSERGGPSQEGKGDEEDQFGKATASQNGYFQLEAGITIDSHGTNCKGQVILPNSPPFDFSGNFPICYSAQSFVMHVDMQKPIAGTMKGQGEIAPLLELFFSDSSLLTGHASAEMTLSGTFESPQIYGACDISEGSFEIIEIGALLHDVSAHLEFSGDQFLLTHLKGIDKNGGELAGKGRMVLDQNWEFPFILDMTLNHVNILNQDYASATVNGSLTLTGNKSSGLLKGTLQTEKALISIPEQSSVLMNHIDVTFINMPNSSPPQSLSVQSVSWPLSMDISLSIPKNLTIEGRDLTSEWKGDLKIQGTTKAPFFNGEVTVNNGEYLFNGKPFEINQGTITLAGDIENKTSLYVIASKDLNEVKIDIILKGPIKNPAISFRSNPSLSQREILSWLLFGSGTSEISPFQGSQLSESIDNLDTSQQGPDLLTKIRKALGVDRFDISRNPNSESSVNLQVGKYISDNILISVNKSDVNRIAIEADLTKRIKLQAQVGDDSEGQLLIKWKRDY